MSSVIGSALGGTLAGRYGPKAHHDIYMIGAADAYELIHCN